MKNGNRNPIRNANEKPINSCEMSAPGADSIWDNIVKLPVTVCSLTASVFILVEGTKISIKAKSEGLTKGVLNELCNRTQVLINSEDEVGGLNYLEKLEPYKTCIAKTVSTHQLETVGYLFLLNRTSRRLTKENITLLNLVANQASETLNLKLNRDDYKTLVETSSDIIYELNEDGCFTFANASTIEKFGYSFEELQNITCWDIVHESKRKDTISFHLNKLKAGETSIYYEFPAVTKDGKTIWLGQNVDYTVTNDRAVRAYVIARDITELIDTRMRLKETEEQILAEKTLLRTMVFSSPAAIAMFGKDLNYLAFSEKWMADKSVNEQTIGVGDSEPSKERKELLTSLKNKVLEGEVVSSDSDLILDDEGNRKWIKWVATPWNNTTDGSIGGVIVYADDVTQIVEHEKELKKAKEEALALSKMKEEFLSSMSHEIRTPLNAIIGTTNLLLDENPSLKEDEKFRLLKFSSNNLLSLINNILDFSKIESGNIILEEKDFDLRDLCVNLVNSWKSVANQKDIEILLKWDQDLPEIVKGDRIRLSQILNNLINNALKFTDEGFVQLRVCSVGDSNDNIHFEVRDTGIGIPKKMHKKVFQSFQQVPGEHTLEKGGTGLGLPICESLLQIMDSELELESSEGFGSKFFFDLQMKEGSIQDSVLKSEDINKVNLDLNVLLVEDNTANQFIAASFLEKWGVSFKVATNGKEALDYIENKSFDLILMDMRMPVMDGPTATSHIRKMEDPYFRNVPIIALTASTMLDLRKEGNGYLFDDYLAKPFNPKDFLNVLSKYAASLKTSNSIEVEETSVKEYVKIAEGDSLKSKLNEYTEGDDDFMIEFARNILENMDAIERLLPKHYDAQDIEELGELIHMVKPTLEILGSDQLVETLYEIKEEWLSDTFEKNRINEVLSVVKLFKKELNMLIEESTSKLKKVA